MASTELHEYIHHPNFREEVLGKMENISRILIRKELNTRMEKESIAWERIRIDFIFRKTIMGDLIEKLHRSVRSIKDIINGFKTSFNVDEKIGTTKASCPARLFYVTNIKCINLHYELYSTFEAAGLVFSGLDAFEVLDEFETVLEKAFQARISVITEEKIQRMLRKKYADRIRNVISAFLDGDFEKEIIKIKENISATEKEHESFNCKEETLSSLQTTVIDKIKLLQENECTYINTEEGSKANKF